MPTSNFFNTHELLPVVKCSKNSTIQPFNGYIWATATEGNTPSIDLTHYMGGSLDFTPGTYSGNAAVYNYAAGIFNFAIAGNCSFSTWTSEDGMANTFHPLYTENASTGALTAAPAFILGSQALSFPVTNIHANYCKFVPTVNGNWGGLIKFTPTNP